MYAKHILFSLLNISDDLPIGSYRGHLSKFLHCKKPLYCTFFKKLQKEILYTYIHTHTHTHTHTYTLYVYICCCSVAQSCPTLCNPVDRSTSDFIQPSCLLLSLSLPVFDQCLSVYLSISLVHSAVQ